MAQKNISAIISIATYAPEPRPIKLAQERRAAAPPEYPTDKQSSASAPRTSRSRPSASALRLDFANL
jgi:hypothetical protein